MQRGRPPRVFWVKSAQSLEKKRVEFLRERKRMRKGEKRGDSSEIGWNVCTSERPMSKRGHPPIRRKTIKIKKLQNGQRRSSRSANKGDKLGQRTGMEVRTQRTTASARKRIKRSARLCGGEHGGRIARQYQLIKYFTGNSRN